MAEIEIGVMARQCLNRRIPDQSALRREVGAWQQQRNRDAIRVDWRFTTEDARIKLKSLYPPIKADEAKRKSFVEEYAALWEEAQRTEARIFFADEAHFRADAELRGKWVLKGEPALVDSTSPRYGEKASYYSAVCLETGEVEWMELEGNSNSGTSAAFLDQLRKGHAGPLNVIWDNAPAHRTTLMDY